MNREETESEVSRLWWYHSIPLGDGLITPGVFNTSALLPKIGMPDDLRGRSVLDVGAWDGFFSFEAERRGADRVVATDSYAWEHPGKEGFELARRILGSKVEDKNLDVLELSTETVGTFDLVLFLGVLYHMKDPLIGLEHVASVTRDHLIVSTAVDLVWHRRPAVAFYPGSEYGNDPTNWWGPNTAAILGMLQAVGFQRVSLYTRPFPSMSRKIVRALVPGRTRAPIRGNLRVQHAVFHAWKTPVGAAPAEGD